MFVCVCVRVGGGVVVRMAAHVYLVMCLFDWCVACLCVLMCCVCALVLSVVRVDVAVCMCVRVCV